MPYPYERAFYRIHYPSIDGPRLVIGYDVCRVIDCSEQGLRYCCGWGTVPPVGAQLRGRLRFPRGVEVRIEGEVMRVQGTQVALQLTGAGIPFRVILKEQLHLRRVQVE